MARAGVLCLVLLATAGWVQSQDIAAILNSLNEVCKPKVLAIVGGCDSELRAAASAVGVSFPPAEGETVDETKVMEYADSNPSVSTGCCSSVCKLTQVGCGCDDGTYNALVQALSDNLGFATTVMEKVRDQCAGQGTNFKVTLKGYIDSSGNEVCASDPLIECKDD